MKRCLIIYNQTDDGASADEADVLEQVSFVEHGLKGCGYMAERLAISDDFRHDMFLIDANRYDFVYNLVEAVWGHDELIHFAPSILALRNIRFSGCPAEAAFMTGDKLLSKRLMRMAGIAVPSEFKVSEWTSLKKRHNYIVKPIAEDGSVGITEESVFCFEGNMPSVLCGRDDTNWFIEEYIDGRELNVSVIATKKGPRVLRPAEIVFLDYPKDMPRIVSYKAKWDEESFQFKNSVRHFDTNLSDALIAEINDISLKCWKLFNLHGYARIDLRTDGLDGVYVIEVNANPCISADGGFVAACHHEGMTDETIIDNIISDLN